MNDKRWQHIESIELLLPLLMITWTEYALRKRFEIQSQSSGSAREMLSKDQHASVILEEQDKCE